MNIKDIKDKYKNTNLYKQMILKAVLSNKKTNIFGGFADYKDTEKFIALKFHKDIEEGINHNEK